MQAMAKVTSKGQVTIPKAVREELGLGTGSWVIFRIVPGERADIVPVPNFLDLAGSVPVPPEKRGATWEEIQQEGARARAEAYYEKTLRETR